MTPSKPELKRIHFDNRGPDRTYPDDTEYFSVDVDLSIGARGSAAADNFFLTVCTPRWFEENLMTLRPDEPTHETTRRNLFGRHFLFVHRFDEAEIEGEILQIIDKIEGENWNEIALKLSRHFSWEFEDYQDNQGTL